MNHVLQLKSIFIFLAGVFFIYACCTAKKQSSTQLQSDDGYQTVTVIDYSELSGCGFILIINDSTKLIPENLLNSYKKNNLMVKVKYKVTNKPNTCMVGKTITILDIKPVN